jgi:hypothetical protein
MASEPSVKKWINVPDRSKFVLTTSASPANVDITVVIKTDTGAETIWTNDEILNKTKTLTVRSPRRYRMAVTMKFAGAATTLDFDARVIKPDGATQHGKRFHFEASPPPKTQFANISVITKLEE